MNENTKSRTEHSVRNAVFASGGKISIVIMGFICRIVFTHTLSQDYVGVNGLFYMILYALSLPEIGLSTAMAYNMYEPVVNNDIEKQQSLLIYYSRFLRNVAIGIGILGLSLIPFMRIFVYSEADVSNVYLIYCMYLANTLLSYVGIYRRIVLDAHQLYHYWSIYQALTCLVQQLLQIVCLIVTHNYILYLSLLLVATICANILTTRKANELFPYAKERKAKCLPEAEEKEIKKNLHSILLQKGGDIAVNNTDCLILSAIAGLDIAGIYYLYYLIVESIRGVYCQVVAGVTASVGNLGVSSGSKRIKGVFDSIYLLGHWVYGLTAICFYLILDEFIGITFGEVFVFDGYMTLLICVNFYLIGLCQAGYLFRDSLGLFNFDRYRSIIAATINLISSIVLGLKFGAEGVMLGTLVSTVAISIWLDPVILYKKKFKLSSIRYFAKFLLSLTETVLAFSLSLWLCSFITTKGIFTMLLRAIIGFVITNMVYFICNYKSEAFAFLYDKGMQIVKKKLETQ